MTTKSPHADDIATGARIRATRIARRMSQEALGEHLGITFQQIQKYEKGTNRVSASRLIAIAKVLGVTAGALIGETDATTMESLVGLDRQQMRAADLIGRLPDGMRAQVFEMIAGLVDLAENGTAAIVATIRQAA
jgi:transcriptional regulator with XRE-family HTH domain